MNSTGRISQTGCTMPPLVSSAVSLGRAAALLRLVGQPKATFLLTRRCNINCAHCFAPRGKEDIDPEVTRAAINELKSLPHLYFSGGEPFQYLGEQRNFLDLVHFSAERVGRLSIATNGAFLPKDTDGARSCLSQFPHNTTFILSVDRYHAAALARIGKSLLSIFRTLYDAASFLGLGFEINVRYNKQLISFDDWVKEMGVDSGIVWSLHKQNRVQANRVSSQNAAMDLPSSEAFPVSITEFTAHSCLLGKISLFVNPQGVAINNPHAVYLNNPPAFSVLGDLHQEGLATLIWRRFLQGNRMPTSTSKDSILKEIRRRVERYFSGIAPYDEAGLNQIAELLSLVGTPITREEVCHAVRDTENKVIWQDDFPLE